MQTVAIVSGTPSPSQSVSIAPSPSWSAEVSITPSPLRSRQSEGALAILVTEAWPSKARLATQTSKLKSTAVREGQLLTSWISDP